MSAAKIRALIVDDEPTARRGIRLLLEQDPDVIVTGEAASGTEAVKRILADKPDLVFLDVQIPEMDGFHVLQTVNGRHAPAIIFVTAFDEHALKAFEVNAVDYLLKPYDDERFWAAVRRAKAELQHRQTDQLGAKLNQLLAYFQTSGEAPAAASGWDSGATDRILLKSGGEIFFLKADEIDWVEAEGDYMKFHTGGRTHLLRETMARLEARLDAKKFIRIHRSTMVNIDRVKKLSPSFAGEYAVILADGTKLKLSRGYYDRLQQLLKSAL